MPWLLYILEACPLAWKRPETWLMSQEHGGPCPHVIMAAGAWRRDPYTLFTDAFTLLTYRYTYQASIHPVIVRDLELWCGCLPPHISKKIGRLKSICIRKHERYREKKTRHSNLWCRLEGQNKRSCRTANDSRSSAQRDESDTDAELEQKRRQ